MCDTLQQQIKKVLITGVSGFLGATIAEMLLGLRGQDNALSILGAYNSFQDLPQRWSGYASTLKTVKVNVSDGDKLKDIISDFQPDLVIHCAAIRELDYCESHHADANTVNVQGTDNVARACSEACARLVFISTDMVYDGKDAKYSETSELRPINLYGKTKAAAEVAVQTWLASDDWLIIRLSRLFGTHPLYRRPDIIAAILEKLKAGQEVNVYTDEHRHATHAPWVAKTIIELYQNGAHGVFHVCGDECVSGFEFAQMIADTFGFRSALLIPASADDRNLSRGSEVAPRPKRIALENTKLRTVLGKDLMMPSIIEILQSMRPKAV